jgi:hypothetical protein
MRVYRSVLQRYVLEGLSTSRIPVTPALTVQDYFASPGTISDWTIMGLPSDTHSVQNGLLVTQTSKYCILIDPQGQGLRWITNLENKRREEAARHAIAVSPSAGATVVTSGASGVADRRSSAPAASRRASDVASIVSPSERASRPLAPPLTAIRQGGDRFKEVLELAVQEGEVVIVADVDGSLDPVLESILEQHTISKGATKLLQVGDNFVELSKDFR